MRIEFSAGAGACELVIQSAAPFDNGKDLIIAILIDHYKKLGVDYRLILTECTENEIKQFLDMVDKCVDYVRETMI